MPSITMNSSFTKSMAIVTRFGERVAVEVPDCTFDLEPMVFFDEPSDSDISGVWLTDTTNPDKEDEDFAYTASIYIEDITKNIVIDFGGRVMINRSFHRDIDDIYLFAAEGEYPHGDSIIDYICDDKLPNVFRVVFKPDDVEHAVTFLMSFFIKGDIPEIRNYL